MQKKNSRQQKLKDRSHARVSRRRIQNKRQRKWQRNLFFITLFLTFMIVAGFFIQQWGHNDKDKEVVATATEQRVEDSYTVVVNRSYPIEAGYIAGTGQLVDIGNGFRLESKAAAALEEMLRGLEESGMEVRVKSAYRTDADQESLYTNQIYKQGNDPLKAATISALPGTSEHQIGLAVDFTTDGKLNWGFAETKEGQWLLEHCVEYGFIHRYPQDKVSVTGIIWEPWHFRYVGSAAVATAIKDSGLCMEEYYEKPLNTEDINPYLPYLQ